MFGKSEVSAASSFDRTIEVVNARMEPLDLVVVRKAARIERVADCFSAMAVEI